MVEEGEGMGGGRTGSGTGVEGVGKGPGVDFVKGAVVDVGAVRLGERTTAEVFLLIGDPIDDCQQRPVTRRPTYQCFAHAMTPWLWMPLTVSALEL